MSKQGCEVVLEFRTEIIHPELSSDGDRRLHLTEKLAAMRTSGHVNLEAAPINSRQRTLQIVRDQFNDLLASERSAPEAPQVSFSPYSASRALRRRLLARCSSTR